MCKENASKTFIQLDTKAIQSIVAGTTDETLATQHSHIVVSRKISPDIEEIRQAIEIKTQTHVLTFDARQNGGVFFEGRSKMTQISRCECFAKHSQLSHKERSTGKACNETLKVPDIE